MPVQCIIPDQAELQALVLVEVGCVSYAYGLFYSSPVVLLFLIYYFSVVLMQLAVGMVSNCIGGHVSESNITFMFLQSGLQCPSCLSSVGFVSVFTWDAVYNTFNGYPTRFIDRATERRQTERPLHGQQPSTRICIPYTKGVGEQIQKVCSSQGIQVTFRSWRTLSTMLTKVRPHDLILTSKRCCIQHPM